MYFVGTHCGGRLAQQKEIHKECNLLALIGAELGQQVEIPEECILFVQRLHRIGEGKSNAGSSRSIKTN